MAKHSSRFFRLLPVVSLGLFFFCFCGPITAESKAPVTLFQSKGIPKDKDKSVQQLPDIPDGLDRDKINAIVAGLSDDQVRRLLMRELEKSAAAGVKKRESVELGGIYAIVRQAEENITLFQRRLAEVRAGAVAVPDFLPQAYSNLKGRTVGVGVLHTLAAIAVLFAGGLVAEWLFGRYAAGMRNRLTSSAPAHWAVRVKRRVLWAAVEFLSILVFCIATSAVFFLFYNTGQFARLVFLTYLIAVLVVRGTGLLVRFFLAPEAPDLRFLPLRDDTARSIHRCVMAVVLIFTAGFVLRELLGLQGTTQETILFIRATASALISFILGYLIFTNREAISGIIRHGSGDHSAGARLFRTQLASFWHLLVIPYLVLVWALWMFYLLVGRHDLVVPILALISSLPIYFILDWMGQRLLSTIFGLVDRLEEVREEAGGAAAAESGEAFDAAEGGEATDGAEAGEAAGAAGREGDAAGYDVSRLVPVVRRCLSLSIAGVLVFWLLHLWGLEVRVGEEVTRAAVKVLMVVSLAYVAWRLIEEAINRRLRAVRASSPVDEDSEAGGAGGSRIGTLLQILRKFLLIVLLVTVSLIVLSAIGIDISPLLAGAGIIGLALGLGTQNLIKDIVSGLFFLIDDAFRIGDYIESGKAKGTVEGISIRSLKLRATRGMVHNVPFSQLGMVTNFSRDYIITKLDVPVPFDTDIDRVRKVVKKIDKEVRKDEELGPGLLGPIKSAGVRAFGDSSLMMRVKFKSKPGIQFLIQRQVLRRLQELFAEQGLEFATRHVMVHMPEGAAASKGGDEGRPGESAGSSAQNGLLSAAAAAAIAAVVAEEEETRRKLAEQEGESK